MNAANEMRPAQPLGLRGLVGPPVSGGAGVGYRWTLHPPRDRERLAGLPAAPWSSVPPTRRPNSPKPGEGVSPAVHLRGVMPPAAPAGEGRLMGRAGLHARDGTSATYEIHLQGDPPDTARRQVRARGGAPGTRRRPCSCAGSPRRTSSRACSTACSSMGLVLNEVHELRVALSLPVTGRPDGGARAPVHRAYEVRVAGALDGAAAAASWGGSTGTCPSTRRAAAGGHARATCTSSSAPAAAWGSGIERVRRLSPCSGAPVALSW